MSFGFSVGDFIAAADLIAQVVSALREAGGSASQHQHITNKLGFLDRAIRDVNRLEPAEGLETTLEAIKTTALTCQLPLLEFLENIRRYDNSLGPGQSSGVMKDVFLKMKWQVSKKLEAAMKLEAEIVAYLGAISLLLGLYKVKVDALVEQRARSRFESLTTILANLHIQTQTVSNNVAQVRYQVEQGTHIVRKDIEESSKETSQALKSLQQNCFASVSEFLKTAGTLSEVTLRTCSKVSEIYNAVLWVQTRLSEPDTRHTWLQEPMRWEDAYGRVFPIPAEFDYLMMEGALRGHFRKGRGKKLVERNQWQLFDPSSPRNILSAENWEPFPGMKITMAMIIPQSDNQMVCPRLNCSSKSYTDALGGGKLCSECNTWFDSLPKSSSPQKITAIVDSTQYSGEPEAAKLPAKTTAAAKSGLQIRNEDTGSDSEFEIDEEDLRLLKNARVRLEGPKQLHLKKREADVVITEEVVSLTPLSWAAGNGNDTRVNLLLAKDGIDLDLKDSQFSRTPLSWAAENGHEAVVKLLLETGKVEVDSKDKYNNRTPLSWAAGNGHEAVVKLLLETGKVEVDSKDKYNNRTPLSCAAENGHEAVVKLLLETGKAEVDSGYDRTPLSWAAENGHETVVKLLLETGRSRDVE